MSNIAPERHSTLIWDPKGGPHGDGEYVPVVESFDTDENVDCSGSAELEVHIQELPEAGGFHNDFRGCADMDGEGWGAAVFTPDEWLCQQGPIERALQALVGLNHDVLTAVKSLKRAVEGSNDNCMSVSALTEDVVVWKEASCRYASLPTMCRLGNPEDHAGFFDPGRYRAEAPPPAAWLFERTEAPPSPPEGLEPWIQPRTQAPPDAATARVTSSSLPLVLSAVAFVTLAVGVYRRRWRLAAVDRSERTPLLNRS